MKRLDFHKQYNIVAAYENKGAVYAGRLLRNVEAEIKSSVGEGIDVDVQLQDGNDNLAADIILMKKDTGNEASVFIEFETSGGGGAFKRVRDGKDNCVSLKLLRASSESSGIEARGALWSYDDERDVTMLANDVMSIAIHILVDKERTANRKQVLKMAHEGRDQDLYI